MRRIAFKVFVALAVSLALVTVCAVPAEAAYSYNLGSRRLAAGQYFEVKAFIAKEGAGMSYNVTTLYGPNFDVLLMDKANFDVYKSGGSSFSYHGVSRLNVNYAYADTGIGGLTTGTEYHLVIDNTDRPAGGAAGNQEVQVFFEFGAANVDPLIDSNLILILVIVVMVAVAVVVVLFLFMRSRGKRAVAQQQTQYAPPYQQPSHPPVHPQQQGMKTCPQCGGQATMEYVFCPRCGFKY